MAGGRPEPDGEPGTVEESNQQSPVVAAWEKVRWIKERGGCGELLIFRPQTDDLNRQDLMSNRDIIAPVLNHRGNSASKGLILVHLSAEELMYIDFHKMKYVNFEIAFTSLFMNT